MPPSTAAPSLIRRRGIRSKHSNALTLLCGESRYLVLILSAIMFAMAILLIGVRLGSHYAPPALAAPELALNIHAKLDIHEGGGKRHRHIRMPAKTNIPSSSLQIGGLEQQQQQAEENILDDETRRKNEEAQEKENDADYDDPNAQEMHAPNHDMEKRKSPELPVASEEVDAIREQIYQRQVEIQKDNNALHLDDEVVKEKESLKMHEEAMQKFAQERQINLEASDKSLKVDADSSKNHQHLRVQGVHKNVPPTNPFQSFKPLGGRRYEEYKNGSSPKTITLQMKDSSDKIARERREFVKNAMKHAWSGYKKYAFGADELLPISKKAGGYWGGLGVTLVDSLDTLWLMGLHDEFWEGRDWVRDKLSFNSSVGQVSVFETTIRSLGGLLAAYDLSGDAACLEKAEDLGNRLLGAFESPNGIPYGFTVLTENSTDSSNGWSGQNARIAEAGTLQLEFRFLSHVTKKPIYAEKANKVFDILVDNQPSSGLYPILVPNDIPDVEFDESRKISLGSMGDSLYEYMLKTWIQGGKKEEKYRKMFEKAMDGVHDKLVQKSSPDGLTFVASLENGIINRSMEHLACFMGGLWALGAYTNPDGLDSPKAQRDLVHGKAITYTCYQMYARFPTGLAPEIASFDAESEDQDMSAQDSRYLLRPETVESLFILNFLTGDPVYREWGWEIFQAIERFCRTDEAYGQLSDVGNINGMPEDKMESFFLAETLKYLYLLFDPDTKVDILNTHVFNTEAHPLRRFDRLEQELAAIAKQDIPNIIQQQ